MKRHVQTTGVRKWAGNDLVDLQAENLKILDSFFEEYGSCIIKGCEILEETTSITPGIVALAGMDQDNNPTFKVAPFSGVENVKFPVYLTLSCSTVERAYADGKVKPIAYNYTVSISNLKPENIPYLEITSKGGKRFVDVTGITSKLDLTGDGKDVTISFATPSTRENISAGEKLSTMFGKIRKYFLDLKNVAFTGKAEDITEDASHRFFTDTERTKLNGVEKGANNYTHPGSHPASMITEDTSHRFFTDTERTKLSGIEAGANKYVHPSSHSADMITDSSTKVVMTAAERTKLGGIAAGANNYTHPGSHPANMITEDASHRFFTDTERTKLNGIAAGANKYVHPSSHSADMITDSSTKVVMTAAERTKLGGITAGANNYTHPSTHPASIITLDASHRFVSDSEKTTWNSKAAGDHSHYSLNPSAIPSSANLNNYTTPGMYYCAANATVATLTNSPTTNAFSLLVEKHAGTKQTLTEYVVSGARTFVRNNYSGTWGTWERVYTTANKPTYSEVGAAAASHNHDTVYAKLSHNHDAAYQPKGSYAAATHSHTKNQITDFPTSLPASDVYAWAKASTKPSYAWSEITSKPTIPSISTYNASKGYQIIGNICYQWGSFSIGGNTTGSTTFATSFSSVYSVVACWDKNYTGAQENWGVYSVTNSGFSAANGDGSTRVFRWFAVGYKS